jgi:hypothetical protein
MNKNSVTVSTGKMPASMADPSSPLTNENWGFFR